MQHWILVVIILMVVGAAANLGDTGKNHIQNRIDHLQKLEQQMD